VILTPKERKTLEALVSPRTESYRKVRRARLILLAANGVPEMQIAKGVSLSRAMVLQRRQRFARGDGGVDGLPSIRTATGVHGGGSTPGSRDCVYEDAAGRDPLEYP